MSLLLLFAGCSSDSGPKDGPDAAPPPDAAAPPDAGTPAADAGPEILQPGAYLSPLVQLQRLQGVEDHLHVDGLVAITPACGFVGVIGALVIGVVAGLACFWAA